MRHQGFGLKFRAQDPIVQATRLAALHWLDMLLRRSRAAVMAHHSVLLPALFDALNADSDKVVQEALAVQVRAPLANLALYVPSNPSAQPVAGERV